MPRQYSISCGRKSVAYPTQHKAVYHVLTAELVGVGQETMEGESISG
ncbi:protein of unknown function [Candidatus Promineifilum breve]|uniref:Uncharacterized protein n=1 Tax=Candidatus Promineifilum breve TaxID=1806508 RepID=A0A160T1P8_9CHLR|nr:protein of unknown function [Candidatus Promineifilum breve]